MIWRIATATRTSVNAQSPLVYLISLSVWLESFSAIKSASLESLKSRAVLALSKYRPKPLTWSRLWINSRMLPADAELRKSEIFLSSCGGTPRKLLAKAAACSGVIKIGKSFSASCDVCRIIGNQAVNPLLKFLCRKVQRNKIDAQDKNDKHGKNRKQSSRDNHRKTNQKKNDGKELH
jgi:hypothetical protein